MTGKKKDKSSISVLFRKVNQCLLTIKVSDGNGNGNGNGKKNFFSCVLTLNAQ